MGIYFSVSGNPNGKAIVFLHGGGVGGWMWKKQLEYFKDFQCIVPDLPEHGKSKNEGPFSISDCAERIASLIETSANGGKACIVGHSLGAKVTVQLLAARPDLVESAVVASAFYKTVGLGYKLMKMIHRPFVYKFSVWMMKSEWMLKYTVKNFKFPDSSFEENCAKDFRGLTSEMLYRQYDQLYQYSDLPDGLGKAEAPTLFIAGSKELEGMIASLKSLKSVLPGSRGITILKADHTYPWSMFEFFNKLVGAWLEHGTVIEGPIKEV